MKDENSRPEGGADAIDPRSDRRADFDRPYSRDKLSHICKEKDLDFGRAHAMLGDRMSKFDGAPTTTDQDRMIDDIVGKLQEEKTPTSAPAAITGELPAGGAVAGKVEVGTSEYVELTSDRLDWVRIRYSQGDQYEDRRFVAVGNIQPMERLIVDGEQYFRVEFNGDEFTEQLKPLIERIAARGGILSGGRASDAFSAILGSLTPATKVGHARLGVFAEADGRLRLCTEPIPILPEQAEVFHECSKAIAYESSITKEDVLAWLRFPDFLHLYEVLPCMGASAIAPVALELRRLHLLFPGLLSDSPRRDLGKTSVARTYSEGLYGRSMKGAGSIESDFRIAVMMDAASLPLTVDEAEELNEKEFGARIKSRFESEDAGMRGTKAQGMSRYKSATVLFLTSNFNPFHQEQILKRLFRSKYDDGQAEVRKKKAEEFDKAVAYLADHPVGFGLARHLTVAYPTVRDLAAAIDLTKEELRGLCRFKGPTRPVGWAIVYLGLKLWESYGRSIGIGTDEWSAPSIEKFVREVVEPVETDTWGAAEQPAREFQRWWATWRATNREQGGPKGVGVIWKPGVVKRPDGTEIVGSWVTSAVLGMYNNQAAPTSKFEEIGSLAKALATSYDIPLEQVLDLKRPDADERHPSAKNVWYAGAGGHRSAFVPVADGDAILDGNTENSGKSVRPPDSLSENALTGVGKSSVSPGKTEPEEGQSLTPVSSGKGPGKEVLLSENQQNLPTYRENLQSVPPENRGEQAEANLKRWRGSLDRITRDSDREAIRDLIADGASPETLRVAAVGLGYDEAEAESLFPDILPEVLDALDVAIAYLRSTSAPVDGARLVEVIRERNRKCSADTANQAVGFLSTRKDVRIDGDRFSYDPSQLPLSDPDRQLAARIRHEQRTGYRTTEYEG